MCVLKVLCLKPNTILISDPIDWIPASSLNARSLEYKAFVGGKEGWDGSPLWVIRARHNNEYVPGKLAIKHRSAYIPYGGQEVQVQNFEVSIFRCKCNIVADKVSVLLGTYVSR